jgi:Tol biopolymer transport system component
VPAEGGEATRLCSGEDPSWAPNSRTIVCARRGNGGKVLSYLDFPTKRVKDGAQISGSASQPSWAR